MGRSLKFCTVCFFIKTALKRISVRYSGDAYSFHCGMHAIVTMGWNLITLVVGWVGECCSEPSIWAAIP